MFLVPAAGPTGGKLPRRLRRRETNSSLGNFSPKAVLINERRLASTIAKGGQKKRLIDAETTCRTKNRSRRGFSKGGGPLVVRDDLKADGRLPANPRSGADGNRDRLFPAFRTEERGPVFESWNVFLRTNGRRLR